METAGMTQGGQIESPDPEMEGGSLEDEAETMEDDQDSEVMCTFVLTTEIFILSLFSNESYQANTSTSK